MSHIRALQSLLTFFSLTVCPVAVGAVNIAVAGPLSGPYAAFGQQLKQGAEQAVKDLNAAGGYQGKPYELLYYDDACEPKQAVAVANRLVDEDNLAGVVGHFCSSSTIPASYVYADMDVVMITPASTNPFVTERAFPTIFRMCGRDDQQGSVAANFISETLKAKRVVVIHDKDTYGKGLADAMIASLEASDIKPVLYEGLTRGEKDYNALVTRMKQLNADAVYFGGLHTEAGPLLRQIREQNLSMPFISGDGIVSEDFAIAAGGPHMLTNVYMTFGRDPRDEEAGAALVKAFRAEGIEPEGYTLYAYASVQALASAIEGTAQPVDGVALSDWLHDHTVETVMGPKRWDDKGDLTQSDYIIYSWDTSGAYQPIEG